MHITCTLDCSSKRQALITTYVPGESNKTILYTQRELVNTWANKDYHRDSIYCKISCFTFLFKTILCFLLLTVFTDISMTFLIFFCRLHVKKNVRWNLWGFSVDSWCNYATYVVACGLFLSSWDVSIVPGALQPSCGSENESNALKISWQEERRF